MSANGVRVAAEADLPEVGRMLHDFNREFGDPAPDPAWLAERLRQLAAGGETIVLISGEPPCGLAVVRVRADLWSEANEAYLAELYVRPARRGAGHGRALLLGALDAARARDCAYIHLNTDETDLPARELYAATGFRPDSERLDAPTCLYLERSL